MNRRQFIKNHVAGTSILAASGLVHKASAENLPSPSSQNPDLLDVDVLVVGGGSAGHVAAIQAGRMGAKTVLLERGSQLGGYHHHGGRLFSRTVSRLGQAGHFRNRLGTGREVSQS
jgi:ribulose 1,5-bisphosphate synthetase/thiazole synthase